MNPLSSAPLAPPGSFQVDQLRPVTNDEYNQLKSNMKLYILAAGVGGVILGVVLAKALG